MYIFKRTQSSKKNMKFRKLGKPPPMKNQSQILALKMQITQEVNVDDRNRHSQTVKGLQLEQSGHGNMRAW